MTKLKHTISRQQRNHIIFGENACISTFRSNYIYFYVTIFFWNCGVKGKKKPNILQGLLLCMTTVFILHLSHVRFVLTQYKI